MLHSISAIVKQSENEGENIVRRIDFDSTFRKMVRIIRQNQWPYLNSSENTHSIIRAIGGKIAQNKLHQHTFSSDKQVLARPNSIYSEEQLSSQCKKDRRP